MLTNTVVDQYDYDERQIDINHTIRTKRGPLKVDILVRNKKGKPYLIVMVETNPIYIQKLRAQLEEILKTTNISYGVYRYGTEENLPGFLGLVKKKRLLSSTHKFKELEDYPRPRINIAEVLINFLLNS